MMEKQTRRILVVEDDAEMKTLLEKLIFEIIPEAEICWATGLEQAFTKLIQKATIMDPKPYELIIADIFLKGSGTGLDLWRVLHATYPLIPFLVISSLSESNVVAAVGEIEKKNLLFLKKPFSVNECKHKIKNILANDVKCNDNIIFIKALTEYSLLSNAHKHQQMANLLILRMTADWLEKQVWLDEPYGGQNPAQDLLFQVRLATVRLWELFFSKKRNRSHFDQELIHDFIRKIAELAPELNTFVAERSRAMKIVFDKTS